MSDKYPGGLVTAAAPAGYSVFFDGTGDFLSIANNTALNVGSGDFCIEAWFNASTLASQQIIVSNAGASGSDNTQIDVVSSQVRFTSSATTYLTSSGTVVTNTWNHVVACRSGTTLSLFVNGSRQATATNSTNFANANNYAFNTGGAPGYGGQYTGYISNVRVVKGSSVYDPTQTSIRVPTQLLNITNTSLLTCNSPAIVDQSNNAFTITANGNAAVSTFTPFPSSYYFYNAPTDGNTRNMLPSNIAGFNPAYGAAAPGVWTLDQAQYFAANRLWPIYDPYFNLTTLMLSGNQPSGVTDTNNNVFKDSSANNFTITRNGNTTQGTFSPFSQTGWGNFFNGSSSLYLATATALGTGNVTVEFWFYPTDTSTTYYGLYDGRGSNNSDTGLGIFQYGRTIEIYGNGLKVSTAANAFSANTWVHFAVVRTSGTCQIYINGIASGSSASYSNNFTSTVRDIGRGVSAGFYFPGYISNLREVTSALYSSNFTPSTTPLTAVSGTTLLTCQSNRFVDNSTNNYAITVTAGAPSVLPFSPFAPTAAYSAATVGGSGYFAGGSTNNLTLTTNAAFNITFGSTDSFICELWVNWSTVAANQSIVDNGGANGVSFSNWSITTNASSQITMSWGDSGGPGSSIGTLPSTIVPTVGTWFHIALVKTNADWALFINGTRATSFNGLNTANKISGTALQIATGISSQVSGNYFSGYISGLRIYKGASGSAPYAATSTTITVPTAPPTAITNTSLLMNYTNAAIIDATSDNVFETLGNAQISTTQSRFGGSSMYFDGNGDYLILPDSTKENLRFGTGDFTIEFWAWKSANGTSGFDTPISVGSTGNFNSGFAVELSASRGFCFLYDAAVRISFSLNPNDSTWHHYAVVRNGSTFALYRDGVQLTTATLTPTLGITGFANIANGANGTTFFNGYIDDLRVTKGFARYTANFVPPTSALQLQ
jgi:hypothetical protein